MRKQVFKRVFVFSVLFSACLNAWAENYSAGPGSTATSFDGTATAVGINNKADNRNSSAIGYQNKASADYSSAFGHSNTAGGFRSSAFGYGNRTMGARSSALGMINMVHADYSTAVGIGNTIGSFIVVGDNPDYPELNTYVFGGGISTSASNAVVLGNRSADGGDNTVSVGAANNLRKIVFVNDGDISATSKDAINGSQLNSVLQNATGINTNNWRNALGINEISNNPSNNLGDVVKYDNDAYSVTLGKQKEMVEVVFADVAMINSADGTLPDGTLPDGTVSEGGIQSTVKRVFVEKGANLQDVLSMDDRGTVPAGYQFISASQNYDNYLINPDTPESAPSVINEPIVLYRKIKTGGLDPTLSLLPTDGTVGGSYGGSVPTQEIPLVWEAVEEPTSKMVQDTTPIKINNLQNGVVSSSSLEAVNGSQLYSLQNQIAQRLGGGASVDSNGGLTAPTYTITNISDDAPTANTYNNVGDALTALDNNTKALNTSLLNKANKNADNLSVPDIIEWQKKLGNGLLQSGNNGLVTGGVVADALALKADKNGSNLTVSDITTWQGKLGNGTIADGNTGLVTGGTVATALQQKANQAEVDTIKNNLNTATAVIDGKLNKDVDNISTTGITNIKNYAKEAVKVAAGDNVSVTTTEDASTNSKTYTVAVSNASIKMAIQNDLNAKADKNASNLVETDITAWQSKLGNGVNAAGNTGLITGNTLYNATKDLVNNTTFNSFKTNVENNYLLKNLSNLDQTDGKAVIMNVAREAVQLADGTNTTVEATTTGNVTTYKVNISSDEIKAAAGTTDLSNLLNGKANLNADNLKPADVIAWQSKLGNGLLKSGNTGLVTGGVVADALALKVDKNGSNLTASDITTWQGKLGNGTIAEGNTGLVTGGTVATALQQKADKTEVEAIKTTLTNTNTTIGEKLNKDVDNISTTGIANIKNYAKEAVKVTAGDNVSVTTTEDASTNSKTYTVAVSNAAIKAAVQNDLNAKANKNADNLTETDVKAWQSKLGNGELTSGNKGLVTGGVVADALALKADKTALESLANSVASANTSLNAKADKDLSNLSDTGVIKVKTIAKEAVSIKAGNNVNVSEEINEQTGNKTYTVGVDNDSIKNVAKEAVKPELDAKANKNADNLTDSDVTSWQQKLGNGKIEAGNNGLVTGNTVNEAMVIVNKRIDEVAARPGGVSGQVLEYLGGGATATEAPTYTITDIATGQDVGHHNVGSALQQLNNNQNLLTENIVSLKRETAQIRNDVKQLRKDAFAGVASAMAMANLGSASMPGQSSFSIGGATYSGQSAYAMGLSRRTENGKWLFKGAVSGNQTGKYGAAVSGTYFW